jgi:hypothetical protein
MYPKPKKHVPKWQFRIHSRSVTGNDAILISVHHGNKTIRGRLNANVLAGILLADNTTNE